METRSYLNAGTVFHVSVLRDSVGHDNRFETGIVNPRDGRPREDAMSQNGINSSGTSLQESEQRKTNNLKIINFKSQHL